MKPPLFKVWSTNHTSYLATNRYDIIDFDFNLRDNEPAGIKFFKKICRSESNLNCSYRLSRIKLIHTRYENLNCNPDWRNLPWRRQWDIHCWPLNSSRHGYIEDQQGIFKKMNKIVSNCTSTYIQSLKYSCSYLTTCVMSMISILHDLVYTHETQIKY